MLPLLLAQLVLPSPPSGPIQPPGMICASGDCSGGPVVYRTSSGPGWDLVCPLVGAPMCSDGREVETTRPSPCMSVAGSGWEEHAIDEACFGPGGLASYLPVTQFVRNSRDLSAWTLYGGLTREIMTDATGEFARFTATSTGNQGAYLFINAIEKDETVTMTVEMRSADGLLVRFAPDSSAATGTEVRLTSEWTRYTHPDVVIVSTQGRPTIGPQEVGSFDVRQVQITKTSTPRPRHDCTTAPCDREPDLHRLATDGFAPVRGKLQWKTRLFHVETGKDRMLIDGRSPDKDGAPFVYIRSNGSMAMQAGGHWRSFGGSIEQDTEEHEYALWWHGSLVEIYRDGVRLQSVNAAPWEWGDYLTLGARHLGDWQLDGEIRDLRHVSDSPVLMMALGDSNTRGTPYATVPFPSRLQSALGPRWYVMNEGVGGETPEDMLGRWTATLRTRIPHTLILWGGGNGIASDQVASEIYASLKQIVDEAIEDGARVVMLTVSPRGGSVVDTPERQAQIEALNALIRATEGVAVVDAYAALGDPEDPTRLAPEYAHSDKRHINDAGHAVVADLILGAIR